MSNAVRIAILADGDRARRELDSVGRAGRSMGATIAKGAKLAAAGLGIATVGALGAALKFGQAAAEDQQSAVRMAQAYTKSAGATRKQIAATEEWITKQGVALGVTDDELRPALTKLVTATESVTKARRLASLAENISARTGKSLESVSAKLAKSYTTTAAGLSLYGIKTKDAEGKTITFDSAVDKLSKKFGGSAAAQADTYQGKIDRLKLRLSETGEAIGYKLLPYGIKFADFLLDDAVPAAEAAGKWIGDHLGPAVEYVGNALRKSAGDANGLGGALDDAKGLIENGRRAWEEFGPAITAVAKQAIPFMVNQLRTTIKTVKFLSDAAIFLYNNAIGPSIKFATAAFSRLLEGVGKVLGLLGSIPGAPAWIGRTADKATAAARQLDEISASINKIPTEKNVSVNVRYSYSGLKGGAGPTRGRGDDTAPSSRQGVAVGRAYTDALVDGIANGTEGLDAALARVDKLIESTFARRLRETQQRLKKKLDGKAETKALERAETKSAKAQKDAVKSTRDLRAQLAGVAAQHDAITKQLETQRDAYQALVDQSQSYSDSVRDAVVSTGSLTALGQGTGFGSVEQLIDQLRAKAATAETYSQVIKSLTAAGLNQTNLQQLIDAGVEGGLGTAQAILAGGPAAIAQINTLTGQLVATGTTLGDTTAAHLYGAGIQAAQGLVQGLESQQAFVEAAATQLGNALAKAVRKALKIHSPSRVFRGIADDTTEGLVLQLDANQVHVKRAGTGMATALTKGFGSPALASFEGGGAVGAVQQISVRVEATPATDKVALGKEIQTVLDAYRRQGGAVGV